MSAGDENARGMAVRHVRSIAGLTNVIAWSGDAPRARADQSDAPGDRMCDKTPDHAFIPGGPARTWLQPTRETRSCVRASEERR